MEVRGALICRGEIKGEEITKRDKAAVRKHHVSSVFCEAKIMVSRNNKNSMLSSKI